MMSIETTLENNGRTHVRYLVLLFIFIITAVNYADRVTLSIAGVAVSRDLGLDVVNLGQIFSAFGIAYLLMQVPGGWLLDKFGSIKVYSYSLFFWSLFTLLQGFVGALSIPMAILSLFMLQFLLGFAEAPA